MTLDLEALLAPVSDVDRGGPDLAYDPQRHEIEQAFEDVGAIDINGTATSGADVDWRRIIAAIVEQSARTKDIWLAVYLCRAGARMGRLEVVETGARYLEGLIDRYWNEGHPGLADYGLEGRTGACDTLASFRAFVSPLRNVPLLDHPRHGSFTGDDLHRFRHGGEVEAGYGAFRAMLEDEKSVERLAGAAVRIDTIETVFRQVDTTLADRAGAGAGTSFAPIYAALLDMKEAVRTFLPEPILTEETVATDAASGGGNLVAGAVPGGVRSRGDVVRMIDLAIDYYRRNEPASPVPLLLSRAREWVNRDFLELLEDIAPAAMGDARTILRYRGGGTE